MDFSHLELLFFGDCGACVCENDEICAQKLDEAYELIENIDSKAFSEDDHIEFSNIITRFAACSMSDFNRISGYNEVLSMMYEVMLGSPFYSEREV